MEKRVELLAPCGSYESFLAAVRAGADAVYLGGKAFGARAYAENFSDKELISAINQAHLFGVRVYLTVNTLVKEQEFPAVHDYILPLYEAGLDGVIVQDMGVLCYIKRSFPELKLHASTQMTITGAHGAGFLRDMGCERIVPARELSLEEIKAIRREVSIEIEAFVHGAMCYCYSGQCLMSSMIGGRSGNRGRCAQPCRLPYKTAGREGHYLSLKDMNTLEHLPELIEAGIDSFKIEGRMKRPEYVAGVVSIYRKYIDKYYLEKGGQGWRVSSEDKKVLADLYIRSETGSGYYEKSRGKDMLTLKKPGYNEADQALLEKLRETYVRELPKVRLDIKVRCRAGEALYGEVRVPAPSKFSQAIPDFSSAPPEMVLTVQGPTVEFAKKQAVSEGEIREQMTKTGGTPFVVEKCEVEAGENAFVPMRWVKQLRRDLLQKIYLKYGARRQEGAEDAAGGSAPGAENKSIGNAVFEGAHRAKDESVQKTAKEGMPGGKKREKVSPRQYYLTEVVQTKEQFEAVYSAMVREALVSVTEYLVADADLLLEEPAVLGRLSAGEVYWGVKCPLILRKRDEKYLQQLGRMIEEKKPDVVYCGTIDVLAWVKGLRFQGRIAGEASLYAWNREALSFWGEELDRVSVPLELDSREIRDLSRLFPEGGTEPGDDRADGCALNEDGRGEQSICGRNAADTLEAHVYGRVPFMVSANCIKLSSDRCDKNRRLYTELTDRMGNVFPVYTNCSHCYNIIYNCLPTSCYDDLWMLLEDKIRAFRMEFTTESGEAAGQIRQTFRDLLASELQAGHAVRTMRQGQKKRTRKSFREITKMDSTQGRFHQSVE